MSHEPADRAPPPATPGRRRSTTTLYVRVLVVQAVTLLALWLLQTTFGGG